MACKAKINTCEQSDDASHDDDEREGRCVEFPSEGVDNLGGEGELEVSMRGKESEEEEERGEDFKCCVKTNAPICPRRDVTEEGGKY